MGNFSKMQISGFQSLSFRGTALPPKHEKTAVKKETQEHEPLSAINMPSADVFVPKKVEIRTIPDFIEFKPAETIEEAKKFARDNFLTDRYELTDIDIANYINEALSEYYNKNNAALPVVRRVLVKPEAAVGLVTINPSRSVLYVGEDDFKNIDGLIEKFLNDDVVKERCQNADKTYNLTESQKKYFEFCKAGTKDYSALSLKEKIGLFLFLRALSGEKFTDNAGNKMTLPDGGIFWIINHEMGHKEHCDRIGPKKYIELNADFKNCKSREEAKAKFREIEPNWETTLKVSDYAASRPVEFVAEVFACLQNGVKFDDDVMELYEKYGGPKIA